MPRGQLDPDLQIDTLINRCAEQLNPANGDRVELWAESVRRYHDQRSEDFTQSWIDHHRRLERVHGGLSQEHAERAVFLEGLFVERAS